MSTTVLFQSAFTPGGRRTGACTSGRALSRNAKRLVTPAIRLSIRGTPRAGLKRPERYDASEWAKSLASLPRSMILRRVRGRIVPNLVVAAAVTALYSGVCEIIPSAANYLSVSPLPHTFLATAMSLLLVFRTNAAYDRYWEGRKMWGRLINISRSMARLCETSMPAPHARLAGRLIVMYSYALMHHLQSRREEEPFKSMCADIAIPDEWRKASTVVPVQGAKHLSSEVGKASIAVAVAEEEHGGNGVDKATWGVSRTPDSRPLPSAVRLEEVINDAKNKPLEVIVQLGKAVKLSMENKESETGTWTNHEGQFMNISIERQMLEQAMSDLIDIMGACERIVKSPVPLSWSRHTSRLLSLWSLTLPFVLVPLEGVLCIPTVAVICWGIFSIEEIAHILEDPFLQQRYSLPLEDLCMTIETDVLGQLIR